MANEATRYGFKPLSPHQVTNSYKYSGAIITEGDMVDLTASAGYVALAATTSGSYCGVAAQTVAAAASGDILIYDDPNTKFVGVVADTLAQTNIGIAYDLTGTTGAQQITTTTTEATIQVLELYSGEAFSSYAKVVCRINKHNFGGDQTA